VLRFWEDEIRHDLDGCVEKVMIVCKGKGANKK